MDVLASMKGWWKNLSEIDNNHLFIIIISCRFMIPTGLNVWMHVSTDQSPCVPCGSSAATQAEGALGYWRFHLESWEKKTFR